MSMFIGSISDSWSLGQILGNDAALEPSNVLLDNKVIEILYRDVPLYPHHNHHRWSPSHGFA